jgi:hypothetical protein
MTTVDLILWRSMVAVAQPGTGHRRSFGWRAGVGRLLRALRRAVVGRRYR